MPSLAEEIFEAIVSANKSLSTKEIADKINMAQVFNVAVSPKSVYDAMRREWLKGNYVFYMTDEKVHPPTYNVDPRYYALYGF